MIRLTDYPALVFVLAILTQGLAVWIGAALLRQRFRLDDGTREDFGVIQAATLTLLGLIIGFTFSMATGRYDQRKNLEEEEANAIGTEYLRVDLLPPPDAAKIREVLLHYLDARIEHYSVRDAHRVEAINTETGKLQAELWAAIKGPAVAAPTPLSAVAIEGMNDVLNTQGYAQAAAWNRIPPSAWALMLAIAMCANVLVGIGSRNPKGGSRLLLIIPFVISLAFALIADIDSPRGGLIRVKPQNLISLSQSLRPG
jgi:hypothetical protein